jgi:hypothetical protein
MQTAELLDLMGMLKLHGMRTAFEETLTEGLKRKLSFHQILGKLFACEIEERKLRSIRYQLGVANLPMTKSLDTFQFAATPINEALIRQWHDGTPLESWSVAPAPARPISRWRSRASSSSTPAAHASSPCSTS